LIEPFFGSEIHQYAYVPGLKCDDPQDLVLLYLKSKTPYTWHADQEHTILSPHRWMVVPPGIVPSGTCPEGGDLLDTAELKRRLERTMAFLKQHQRPHWQVVVEEHTAFLKSQLPAHERFR
jgi:hypothetical protein